MREAQFLQLEADGGHAEATVEESEFSTLLTSRTLDADRTARHRYLVMRASHLTRDRSDIDEASQHFEKRLEEPRGCD